MVLTHDPDALVSEAEEELVPRDAYHPPLTINLKLSVPPLNDNRLNFGGFYRYFKWVDLDSISNLFCQFKWDLSLSEKPLHIMLNILYEILYMAIDLYVPLKKYSTRIFFIWYSDKTKKFIINKKLAHKRYKISNSVAD